MENFWQTLGHKGVKSILEKQLKSGIFSHAYLFKGPEGLGKKTLAHEFSQKLLATSKLSSHPDFISLGIDDKISVENVRTLISKLSVKPFLAKYTVAVIDNAHLLNLSSSNALLKTLEEPSPTSIIILVSAGKLPKTVVSRCQSFIFNPFSPEEFKQAALASGRELQPSALDLCGGSLAKFYLLNQDTELLRELRENVHKLESAKASAGADKILAIREFAELEDAEISEILKAWLSKIKNSLADTPESYVLLPEILKALTGLQTNMNKKFILQRLLLENQL